MPPLDILQTKRGRLSLDDITVQPSASHLARRVLAAFLLTFILSRITVLLIMTRTLPDFYFYLGGTHVHHLNYGIFLLCLSGAATLMLRLSGRQRNWAALVYGVGLGLTFDEFGMWLHLGGGYWQRASYDAIVVVGSALALISVAPAVSRFRSVHWTVSAAIVLAVAVMLILGNWAANVAGKKLGPRLQGIEERGPQ